MSGGEAPSVSLPPSPTYLQCASRLRRGRLSEMGDNLFYNYYASQLGGSGGAYYQTHYRVQRGRGFFSGLWRVLSPLLGSAARHIGSTAVETGAKIVSDAMTSPQQPLKDIAKRRGREGLTTLANKALSSLKGGGRRRRAPPGRRQSKKKNNKNNNMTKRAAAAFIRGLAQSAPGRRRGRIIDSSGPPAIQDIFGPA